MYNVCVDLSTPLLHHVVWSFGHLELKPAKDTKCTSNYTFIESESVL